MSPAQSERNLLFGALALQLDFITRGALLAAVSAWLLDKGKPLGHVLREQGALSEEHLALLDALVEAHLRQHDHDAGRSLAALRLPAEDWDSLREMNGPAAEAGLTSAPATLKADADAAGPCAVAPPAGQRFHVLRPHARGGLGEVFVAEDRELHREVALKEIQGRYAHDPASRARFLFEAQVTGRLEHPGVVPVYGLGTHPDGRHYYAMRFIRGDSLLEAIHGFHEADAPGRDPGERALALRGLLRRFIDVCNAVAYAHSRGVLHRDIKPANVLLGPFGETLLVDWGLARPTGQPTGEAGASKALLRQATDGEVLTQVGAAVGTPGFMSPEQAAGWLGGQGPATDVYGLGATLYCLLTGRPAFTGPDVEAALRDVQRGDFPPPRRVKPAVPAALEAVCLKAMARQPEGRYPSAQALADDVERWVADEPVGAYREPLPARLGRWARRHRASVMSAAAALAVLALSLGVLAVVLTGHNRALAAANGRERQARRDA
jgi:serine/threonine-protein kinase